jgi:hypothetical protein
MATVSGVLTPPTLTRLDRCDRCSAAAQLIALLPAGELLFCGHHAREYRAGLIDIGARLIPGLLIR